MKPFEIVDHHLLKFKALNNVRNLLLPPGSNKQNMLYDDSKSLRIHVKSTDWALAQRTEPQVKASKTIMQT